MERIYTLIKMTNNKSNLLDSNLGKYTITVCKNTDYIDIMRLLSVYYLWRNDNNLCNSIITEKTLNEYINDKELINKTTKLFDELFTNNIIDNNYLNYLKDKYNISDAVNSNLIKYHYMIRGKENNTNGLLMVHPTIAVELTKWMNIDFSVLLTKYIDISPTRQLLSLAKNNLKKNSIIMDIYKHKLNEKDKEIELLKTSVLKLPSIQFKYDILVKKNKLSEENLDKKNKRISILESMLRASAIKDSKYDILVQEKKIQEEVLDKKKKRIDILESIARGNTIHESEKNKEIDILNNQINQFQSDKIEMNEKLTKTNEQLTKTNERIKELEILIFGQKTVISEKSKEINNLKIDISEMHIEKENPIESKKERSNKASSSNNQWIFI